MSFVKVFYGAALFLGAGCSSAWADNLSTVPLIYGVNLVNFAGDGVAGMAVLGRRENFNAHGSDVLTLYLKPAPTQYGPNDWQLVTLFDGEEEKLTLGAGGGADCVLHDFRLVRKSVHDQVRLLIADRDLGEGYADSALVHFKSYELRRNSEETVGRPVYYFELVNDKVSKKPYCDVGEAFTKELGIGPYRRAAE